MTKRSPLNGTLSRGEGLHLPLALSFLISFHFLHNYKLIVYTLLWLLNMTESSDALTKALLRISMQNDDGDEGNNATTHDEQAFSEAPVSTLLCTASSHLQDETTPPNYVSCSNIEFIDNSKLVYQSLKLKCCVIVQIGEGVLEECGPKILEELNHDLIGCLSVLPHSVRALVRRTKIWVNRRWVTCYSRCSLFGEFGWLHIYVPLNSNLRVVHNISYSYGPISSPKIVKHVTCHHFSGWLLWYVGVVIVNFVCSMILLLLTYSCRQWLTYRFFSTSISIVFETTQTKKSRLRYTMYRNMKERDCTTTEEVSFFTSYAISFIKSGELVWFQC